MKDGITLCLIFLVALTIESAPIIWLPALAGAILLQIDKIEKVIKNETYE